MRISIVDSDGNQVFKEKEAYLGEYLIEISNSSGSYFGSVANWEEVRRVLQSALPIIVYRELSSYTNKQIQSIAVIITQIEQFHQDVFDLNEFGEWNEHLFQRQTLY